MPYTRITSQSIESWLAEHNQLFEVPVTPEFIAKMENTCINLKHLLIKANKRINAIALYFAWQGIIKGDPLFTEQLALDNYDFEHHLKCLLGESQARHDIILFIYSCSFLNIPFKNQGKIITIFTDEAAGDEDEYIKLNTVEWSAEFQLKLDGKADLKPTDFNNIIITYRHLVIKAQLLLKLPRLDELLKVGTFNQTALCKMLDLQSYQLSKLIAIAIQMGRFTESQVQAYLASGVTHRHGDEDVKSHDHTKEAGDEVKDGHQRYHLSARNERFIQNIADEMYRGNTFQALNKLLTTTQVLIERGLIKGTLIENANDEDKVDWETTNQSLLTGLDRVNKEGQT